MTRKTGKVEKGWGHEQIWVTNDKYCGKVLTFNQGAKFSMHFHREKMETWYVLSGKFKLRVIDTTNASILEYDLVVGDVWHNDVLVPHQLICVEAGKIIEVSTPDSVEDNYRIQPGDSQNTDLIIQ